MVQKGKGNAKKAFDLAYERECASVIASLREMANTADKPENVWKNKWGQDCKVAKLRRTSGVRIAKLQS
jgi:hypothetical protein